MRPSSHVADARQRRLSVSGGPSAPPRPPPRRGKKQKKKKRSGMTKHALRALAERSSPRWRLILRIFFATPSRRTTRPRRQHAIARFHQQILEARAGDAATIDELRTTPLVLPLFVPPCANRVDASSSAQDAVLPRQTCTSSRWGRLPWLAFRYMDQGIERLTGFGASSRTA